MAKINNGHKKKTSMGLPVTFCLVYLSAFQIEHLHAS
jgi:hypothetical protein